MAKQEINTDRVTSAATKLNTANSNINTAFGTLQNKAKQLDSDWNSAAGGIAQTTMYQLFKNSEARSAVLQNYINLLEQLVNPLYIETEAVNTKLADKFK